MSRHHVPTLLLLGAASLLSGCVAAPIASLLTQSSFASATSCQAGAAVGQSSCNANPLTALLGNWSGAPATAQPPTQAPPQSQTATRTK